MSNMTVTLDSKFAVLQVHVRVTTLPMVSTSINTMHGGKLVILKLTSWSVHYIIFLLIYVFPLFWCRWFKLAPRVRVCTMHSTCTSDAWTCSNVLKQKPWLCWSNWGLLTEDCFHSFHFQTVVKRSFKSSVLWGRRGKLITILISLATN